MSIHASLSATDAIRANNTHPIALRFEEMFPYQLHRYDLHLQRKQRDMDHVDQERTHLNRSLHGEENWLESLKADIELARLQNLNQEVEGLQRTRGSNESQKRLIEGPRDPWRPSKGGPLREFIITANKEWFEETNDSAKLFDIREQEARENEFEARARMAQEQFRRHAGPCPHQPCRDDLQHIRLYFPLAGEHPNAGGPTPVPSRV